MIFGVVLRPCVPSSVAADAQACGDLWRWAAMGVASAGAGDAVVLACLFVIAHPAFGESLTSMRSSESLSVQDSDKYVR